MTDMSKLDFRIHHNSKGKLIEVSVEKSQKFLDAMAAVVLKLLWRNDLKCSCQECADLKDKIATVDIKKYVRILATAAFDHDPSLRG